MAAGVTVGLTAGIVFTSTASADSHSVPTNESTASAFAEAATKPENVVAPEAAPMGGLGSFLKKAAGSAAGSAAYDYIKAVGAIPDSKRKGKPFMRGDAGADHHQNTVDLSRSFD